MSPNALTSSGTNLLEYLENVTSHFSTSEDFSLVALNTSKVEGTLAFNLLKKYHIPFFNSTDLTTPLAISQSLNLQPGSIRRTRTGEQVDLQAKIFFKTSNNAMLPRVLTVECKNWKRALDAPDINAILTKAIKKYLFDVHLIFCSSHSDFQDGTELSAYLESNQIALLSIQKHAEGFELSGMLNVTSKVCRRLCIIISDHRVNPPAP